MSIAVRKDGKILCKSILVNISKSKDDETGDLTQILTIKPGVENDEVLIHDYWEEVFILEGEAVDKRLNMIFTAGMYACRPPGMIHGPYAYPKGCKMLEFRYYK